MLSHVEKHEWMMLTNGLISQKISGWPSPDLRGGKKSVYFYIAFTVSALSVCVLLVLKRNPRVKTGSETLN